MLPSTAADSPTARPQKAGTLALNVHSLNCTPVLLGLPCGSAGRPFSCCVGVLGSTPWLGRSGGDGKGYPLQYSVLENSLEYSPQGPKGSDTTEPLSHLNSAGTPT